MIMVGNMLLPFVFIVCAADLYLLLAAIRFLLAHVPIPPLGPAEILLSRIVDPVPEAIGDLYVQWRGTEMPRWIRWALALLLVYLVRHLLVVSLLMFRFHPWP